MSGEGEGTKCIEYTESTMISESHDPSDRRGGDGLGGVELGGAVLLNILLTWGERGGSAQSALSALKYFSHMVRWAGGGGGGCRAG